MTELLQTLIAVSEKASNIARACRTKQELFSLLIQEKGTKDANPRFVKDFKTLADVLIQETVKHELGNKFPELKNFIRGEESNTFSNTLGETITVEVKQTEAETAELLCKVLDGDNRAAELLAVEVHKDILMDDINTKISGCLDLEISLDDLAVWIDPIDSTAEYINGDNEAVSVGRISLSGLQCVTVLIGVYNRSTGQPVVGVLNQPFYNDSKGRCLWGISYMGKRIFFNPMKDSTEKLEENIPPTICISSSENVIIKELLNEAGYNLIESAGAGYKLLMVILGYADAYILSKGTTFKWDTCGPHAILNALDGGILDFNLALNEVNDSDNCEIKYFIDDVKNSGTNNVNQWCNKGGIIAYRNPDLVSKVLDILSPP